MHNFDCGVINVYDLQCSLKAFCFFETSESIIFLSLNFWLMEELILSRRHLQYLLGFSKENLFTTGPIFGQAADPTAAALPPTDTIEQIDINTVAEHAKQAIRVLPGGMSVLGIFVVGPNLASPEGKAHLCQSLKVLADMCSSDFYQMGIPSNRKFVVLSANSSEKTLDCSSCEILKKGVSIKPMTYSVVPEIIWHEIAALVDLDIQMLISANRTALPLWDQLKPLLLKLEEVINSNGIAFPKAGIVKITDTISEVLMKQKKNLASLPIQNDLDEGDKQALMVDVMLKEDLSESKDVNIVSGDGSRMILSGAVMCRTYVHNDADVQMCKKVINEDIMHSLIARLEMHCDSLIEEEPDDVCDDVVIHEPPRRMMVRLPCSEVLFSDYLFPGELVTEAKQSLQSLLDVSVRDVDILHSSAGLSEFKYDELNTRTLENTNVLPAKNDVFKFIFLVLGILVPIIGFLIFHHQQ
ncbi:protein odr-4 homolog isoform X1 [Bacillus rossius redtenbacheri]|uniref:protein odr-4 homolog isoform X1 n=1 Tax=Bacillus rossius redtenbacheri TaxID=93214 RepID=UPI002FDEFFC8